MKKKVVKSLKEAEKLQLEEKEDRISLPKVKELVRSLEGCTPQTVVGFITAAYLLLPAGAIMAAVDIGKRAFSAKALMELMGAMKAKSKKDNKEE